MIVNLSNGVTQAVLDLQASVTATSTASGALGSASLFVPRNSRIWRTGIIRDDGGNLVRIGDFTGISDVPEWNGDGATIEAVSVEQWVGVRMLERRRVFRACPASVIAARAIRDAFIGSAVLPVSVGPCAICPPLIPQFEFTGSQTVQQVLGALVGETGQEWKIDSRDYAFQWQPQIGVYREGLLTDLGEVFPSIKAHDLTERFQSVTEVDQRTKRPFTAWNGNTPPLWPSQTVLEV